MGAKFSPSLANIAMTFWEEKYIFSVDNPYSGCIVWYGRYIDDLLLIWGGDVSAIPDFARYLDQNTYNLRFTQAYHPTTIHFLDLTLSGVAGEVVLTETYRKEVSGNTILKANSHHPLHTIKSIPVGEFTRARRNCSTEKAFDRECIEVWKRLQMRDYPQWMLHRGLKIAKNKSRAKLLNLNIKKELTNLTINDECEGYSEKNGVKPEVICEKNESNIVPTIVLTYSRQFAEIKNIIQRCLPILYEDDILRDTLKQGCRVVYKRPDTLGKTLSPSMYTSTYPKNPSTWLKYTGFSKCGHTRCKTCKVAKNIKQFHNSTHTETFPVKSFINCNTMGVIYIIVCTTCDLIYVGCTTRKFKDRLREHLNYIHNPTATGVSNAAYHFIHIHNRSTDTLNTFAFERVTLPQRGGDIKQKILLREAFWIWRLKTRVPYGLNLKRELMYLY
ncbi:uncharacterized protein LOC120992413 [Bufo bufo]|uniref:uncharacterized protein LOC120992413 n=1 Tax=Bufo bufo TaxID=8384 RepID=UPI001ABE42A0|nr:uncharacterized protein LOC120992413 [Bufo bufo]